ncbi:MAG: PAS domain S-box protein [gamma proteobacterium endosymbiont of Lamellibrachia anaximandri]|nr:PAS domain S-box protein [gamma proteobacterium endosymbiont of Lamellibrachia anaximandri]MBL3532988.1 PAS domain S-box protein [gamma proteobacterium endosymbiont of Lamellibrachia anaximandri]MBL3598911.1 PAS domain S-box protein [gamma proteobacterium endosymbiont of Lamellibrachia anaximandri]
MEREYILSVLYDLTLTIGGETQLDSLLRKALQRLLYHTAFPAGLVLTDNRTEDGTTYGRITTVVGDHLLEQRSGQILELPAILTDNSIELLNATVLPASLNSNEKYHYCLKLPIDDTSLILLLSPHKPTSKLPLTQIFKPVLANLSRSILLCRNSEQLTHTLESDRDQARSDLAIALERSERERTLLRSLNDTIPDLVWLKDPDGIYLACNKAFEGLYGTTEEKLIGKSDYDFVSRELANFFRENDKTALKAGVPRVNEEWLTFASNGHHGLFETVKTPLRTEQGKVLGVLGIARDITERKDAEEALRASEERFELAIRAANDGLWDWDLQTNEVYYSPRWKSMLGYEDHELENVFSTWEQLVNVDDKPETLALIEDCMSGESDGFETEFRMRHKAGHWVFILSRAIMVRDDKHQPVRMAGTHVDISERKTAERAIMDKEKAEAAALAKSQFLANMSHEIRTPLNGVLGLAKMGERENSLEQSHKLFQRIGTSGQHLLNVVNDILDFSKIDAGKLVVENQPFMLMASVDNAANLIRSQAEEKHLLFHVDMADKLPPWVKGDALRLEQILVNMLSNAVKFTEQGEVNLQVLAQENNLLFRVSDTGIGMSENQLAQLFKPFEQADSSTTRRFGGTGLGLAISFNLAKMMGGDIRAASRVDEGSEFILTMPLVPADQVDESNSPVIPATGNSLQGVRLLAAEDVDINRLILEDMLMEEGAQVTFAENGQQALKLLQEQGVSSFDLVLMDVQMPVMDGYEATRQIKGMAPGLPVIGLTAHALKKERERCFAAGMVDHVTKPIDPELLIATIQRHIQRSP